MAIAPLDTEPLLRELRQMIGDARRAAAVAVNMCLMALNWRIGKRIHAEVLGAKRAEYAEHIVATLSRQLRWSHLRELLPLKYPLQREFYAEMCRIEGWSVRVLAQRIDSMLYERTALSSKPEKLIGQEIDARQFHGRCFRSPRYARQ